MRKFLLYIVLPLMVVFLVSKGCNVGQYEEPAFTLVEQHDMIELRDYPPALAAEVTIQGERKQAIAAGFRLLADFIFGNNTARQKIDMTTPVIEHPSEKIPMTTPVMQQGADGKWVVQFVMPGKYTRETLPRPNNSEIKIREIPARRMAVIRFPGSNRDESLITDKTAELQAYIVTGKLKAKGAPVLAFYDPPWTLPFIRRNEVMLEIAAPAKKR